MNKQNSGKIYRFKLDHNLGYGFAETYDFEDTLMFDGRIVIVFNKHDKEIKSSYDLDEIRKSGIALGPIRLLTFPNVKGLHAWKYLFKTEKILFSELPKTKELQAVISLHENWDNFKEKWFVSNDDLRQSRIYVDYESLRQLETRIINSTPGVVNKFTMKTILDNNEKVSDYYDLLDIGNKNMFVQLINTYYPLTKTKEFLKQLPKQTS